MKISRPVKFGCLIPLIGVVLLILGVSLYDRYAPSRARRALPDSAQNIQEHYLGFANGDFTRCIKAKMPISDFDHLAERLDLKETYAEEKDVLGLDSQSGSAPSWFDPPKASEAERTRYSAYPSGVTYLKYKDGYVYFMALDW